MEASESVDRSSASLANAFRQDLNAIGRALIQAFGLRFTEEVPNLSEPLPRWFDFRFRYVEPKPRHVVCSDRIPNVPISQVRRPLLSFIERVARGEDINPYQGRGLKLRHDSSGRDHSKRTDYLFAAWNIFHFHLSDDPIPAGQYFSKPADWLAFGMVTDQQFVLIDVLRHPDLEGFSDPALLETVARCWPEYMEQFRIKRPSSGERPLTQAEIHHLRSLGGNAPFVYNGQSYIGPGGGYTCAGATMNTTAAMAHIVRTFEPLANACWVPDGLYRSHGAVSMVANPRFSLRLYEGGLGICEEHSRTLFVQPPGPDVVVGDLRWLSDLVVPPWALSEVVKQKDRFDELFCERPSSSPANNPA